MSLTPDEFMRRLTLVVPERVMPKARQVYFDAVTQLHARVVEEWPVDTGYSRAGFTATQGDETPLALPPRNANADYTNQFGQSDNEAAGAIGRAVKDLSPLTLGFTADYAPYVEDRVNVVKSAANEWPDMVARAIENADSGLAEASD